MLAISTHPVATGLPELDSGFGADRGFADDGTTRYVSVDLAFTNRSGAVMNVAAALSVTASRGATAEAVGVGIFVESGADVRYCQDGDPTPVADHLVVGGGVGDEVTVTAYPVAGAGSPADRSAGRPWL
jgi:hypothetical protein